MGAPRKDVSSEAMLALRAQGKSNKEIADHFNVTVVTVRSRIGVQPKGITLRDKQKGAEKARKKKTTMPEPAKEVEKTPVEPQKAPPEPPKPVEVKVVKETPATPQKRQIITTTRLFDFAYVFKWDEKLDQLAREAMPEPWTFKEMGSSCIRKDYYILEQYIHQIFKLRVEEFNTTADIPDKVIHMRGKFCCIHTGLYNRELQAIYMYFERSRPGTRQPWYFMKFLTAQNPSLERVHPLPEHRSLDYEFTAPFDPNKSFRVNFSHITGRADRVERLPEAVRGYWNLPLLLETALIHAQRTAAASPSFPVTASRPGSAAWLLPLYITKPDTPDVVAFVEDMGDYYHCRTVLSPIMAYLHARINGRPTASWLVALLDTNGGGESKGVTPTDERGRVYPVR